MSDRTLVVNCAHCRQVKTGIPDKGLCWTCWYTPMVRIKYMAKVGKDGRWAVAQRIVTKFLRNYAGKQGG